MWAQFLDGANYSIELAPTPRGVPNYAAGQKVKITKGPFKGLTAEIAAATRDGRASIIMQAVYGRGTVKPVKIKVEHIELLDVAA